MTEQHGMTTTRDYNNKHINIQMKQPNETLNMLSNIQLKMVTRKLSIIMCCVRKNVIW